MLKLCRAWVFAVSLPFSLLPLASVAQGPQPAPSPHLQPGGPEKSALPASEGREIRLDVVVTDHAGKAAPGLQQQDFTVLDNKQPTKILSFEAETATATTPDSPTQIFLVVDEVNTSFQRIAYERDEIKKFLGENGGKLAHPVTMIFFSDDGTQIQTTPSVDGTGLIASFDQHETALRSIRRSSGVYGAEDRLQLSLNTLEGIAAKEATSPGRKLVIWISPGWPLLSGPRVDLSLKQEQNIFNTVVRISTALRQARITLYSIDPLGLADAGGIRTIYYREFLKGMTSPKNAQLGSLGLQVIATQTGGQVLFGSNSIRDQLDRCVADASTFYVLTIPAAPADKGNDYHEVEVHTGTPGLTARTRSSYYAQP